MKKFLTIILTFVLAFTAAISLTACKDDEGDQLKLINIPLGDEQYAFAMKFDNVALETSFNEYLAEIKSNGTFDAIMAKYFEGEGEKVGYNYVGDGNGSNEEGSIGAGKFVVATNCPFSPFEYIENGKIYGVDMEIAAGYADIGMAGMTVTEDRAGYRFTTKYFNASLNVIVAADNTDFDACETQADVEAVLASLSGKKIGYQNGTTSVDYVAGFSNIEGKGYDSAALAAYDVINGNLYAVVVDNAPAAAIVASFN